MASAVAAAAVVVTVVAVMPLEWVQAFLCVLLESLDVYVQWKDH